MTIARSSGVFGGCGTDESTLQTVAAGGTLTGTETDVLGDDTSVGEIEVFAMVTAVAASSVDVRINKRRITGQAYQQATWPHNITTINGTVKIPLGRYSASRYMSADVRNNDGSNSVSVLIGYERFKVS